MKSSAFFLVAMVSGLMSAPLYGFYDSSVETHAVVTNVMAFGVVANGTNDNTAAVQSAIDYVTAQPGGGDVVIPEGSYVLRGLELKSNVHLLIDSGAVLNLLESGNMIHVGGDVKDNPGWVENVSIQGVGGRFTVNLPQGVSKTRFITAGKVRNFLFSDLHVNGNRSAYSALTFGVSSFDEATRGMPTMGTLRNASIVDSEYGYGLIQSQACDSVLFTNLFARGGVALRMETGWDKMGEKQYGGVRNVVGRNISAYGAKQAVMMAPVALQHGVVDIDGVFATNCASAVAIADGSLRSLDNPDIIPGSWGKGSSVRNVVAVYGETAQFKAFPADAPSEITNLYQEVSKEVYGAPWIGPSLAAVQNNSEHVSVSNVRAYGFDYVAPIVGDGYGQTEETFTDTDYAQNISGDFWSATTNLNAGGTNWISGDGSVGQIDLTRAEAGHHALNYWGFALEPETDITISSDFRYDHRSGGELSDRLNQAAFGLILSTDSDPATGINRYCLLGNLGDRLGVVGDESVEIAHTNLNVDSSAGGWSDWFRLKWTLELGAENYQGTPSLYDHNNLLLCTGATVDLGIANGTKIWAGYTTGTNSTGGVISGFSALNQVELDNFLFEKSYVNEAPIWLETPARVYVTLNAPCAVTLVGLVLEPNGKRVLYSKLQGPDWLSLDEQGILTGTPGPFDIGENDFEVLATDYEGLCATNRLIVSVGSPTSGNFSLAPVADATTQGLNPTNNYGADRTLWIQDHSSKQRIAYLKFDLSRVPGDQVTNAFVRLKVSDPDTAMKQTVWSVLSDSWQEDTITYSNRPPIISDLLPSPVPVPDLGWWVELNVTDYVQQEWSGDQTLSLAVVASDGFQVSYHSKDDMPGHRPELVVQTIQTTNAAASFAGAVVVGEPALVEVPYYFSLTNLVDSADALSFRLISGPEWLAVAENGDLTGTPPDFGTDQWKIEVTDGLNPAGAAVLKITVLEDNGWSDYVLRLGLSGDFSWDYDQDGQSDLIEYAFGGDPTNQAVQGCSPFFTFYTNGTVGCSYLQLRDSTPGIRYTATWAESLIPDLWSTLWDASTNRPSSVAGYDLSERLLYDVPSKQLMFKVEVSTP